MGWSSFTAESFVRRVAATDDLERVFANFARHLEEMLLHSAALRPVRWGRALDGFVDRVQSSGLGRWRYGSGALAVRGVDIEPRDLDLAVDDAHHAAALLSDLLVDPPHHQTAGSPTGPAGRFHGALIKCPAGAHPTGASPPHEQEPEPASTSKPFNGGAERCTFRPSNSCCSSSNAAASTTERTSSDQR